MIKKDRIRGAIIGTAIGDALGMCVEGLSPSTIKRYYGLVKGYRTPNKECRSPYHNLERGQWTDDTQLMLDIGESIVAKRGIDYEDIIKRHISSFNERRGWGKATTKSIQRAIAGTKWWESGEPGAAGNGPPMKIAPLGILYGAEIIDEFELMTISTNLSRMTHMDPRPNIASVIQCLLIGAALKSGIKGLKQALEMSPCISSTLEQFLSFCATNRLGTKLYKALCKTCKKDSEIRDEVGVKAFVNESFPFTCAMVLKHCDDLEWCLIRIINQGGDADTTGAMAGAMLGAAYGYSEFPIRWKRGLEDKKRLLTLADNLYKMVRK
jgi:ADP-ribosylglycohydrolase